VGHPSGSNGDFGIVSADPSNHLIGTKIETTAVNTANGSQSTSSTYANMPETDLHVITVKLKYAWSSRLESTSAPITVPDLGCEKAPLLKV
jgi:hypothetical protein